jgi:hypothetical protein
MSELTQQEWAALSQSKYFGEHWSSETGDL